MAGNRFKISIAFEERMIGAFITLIAFSSLSLPALADSPIAQEKSLPQATIHFANTVGIQNWQADGDSALYIEDNQHHWYHAQLISPCEGLPFATSNIGFETEANGDFDNFSFITVGRQRCQVASVIQSKKPAGASN